MYQLCMAACVALCEALAIILTVLLSRVVLKKGQSPQLPGVENFWQFQAVRSDSHEAPTKTHLAYPLVIADIAIENGHL